MNKSTNNVSFENTLETLETIVNNLESGNLSLENALNEFELGVKLAKKAQQQLKKAEQRIQILVNDSDEPSLQPFQLNEI